MNKIKKTILSVLLLSFTFLIVHDYVMADIGKSAYQAVSLEKKCQTSKHATERHCGISHLHESIHMMIALTPEAILHSSLVVDKKLSYKILGFSSHDNFVLERPPLS